MTLVDRGIDARPQQDLAQVPSRPADVDNVPPVDRQPSQSRRGGDHGAVLVEFALILPLLMMLVMGILNGGILMNRRESITHAVREGARYGATVPQAQCTPTCSGQSWAQLVRSIVAARSDGHLASDQICVALVSGSGSGSSPPSAVDASHTVAGGTSGCYVDNSADTGLRVQVSALRPDEFDAVLVHFAVNLSSDATAQFEQ